MEDILRLYTEPLPEGHELHNFDEASKQLLSTPRGNIPAKPATVDLNGTVVVKGRLQHTDYEYERHGTRNLFVAVAPFTGTRTVTVTKHRKAQETADFLWRYCMVEHGPYGTVSQPKHIELVMDNLNTHKDGSLKKIWGAKKLSLFKQHVTVHFTPTHGSWLNMAELEINCLRRQGVKVRVATEQALAKIVNEIVTERMDRQAKINWKFTPEKAKEKFPELYLEGVN